MPITATSPFHIDEENLAPIPVEEENETEVLDDMTDRESGEGKLESTL